MKIEFSDGGTPQAFVRINAALRDGLPLAIFRSGAMYQTKVRAAASGRPGPRVQTGDYRRSIFLREYMTLDGDPVALVSSNRPQARRLEFGFVGPDVLGRVFNQPPYPHWRPAMDDMDKVLTRQVNHVVALALQGRVSS